MLATTRNTFASRTDNKLPQLNRSMSFSNAKNAKQKVNDLDERLQDLAKKISDLKLQTRVTTFLFSNPEDLQTFLGKILDKDSWEITSKNSHRKLIHSTSILK